MNAGGWRKTLGIIITLFFGVVPIWEATRLNNSGSNLFWIIAVASMLWAIGAISNPNKALGAGLIYSFLCVFMAWVMAYVGYTSVLWVYLLVFFCPFFLFDFIAGFSNEEKKPEETGNEDNKPEQLDKPEDNPAL